MIRLLVPLCVLCCIHLVQSTYFRKILREKYIETVYETNEEPTKLDFNWISQLVQNASVVEPVQDNKVLRWSQLLKDEDTNGFHWKDCGKAQDKLHPTSLILTPDPLHLPGRITVGFSATVTGGIQAPVQIETKISKKIAGIYVHVKTVNIPDICTSLAGKTCPVEFEHCHCPFQQGVYTLPPTAFDVDIHQSIPAGDYKVTINLLSPGSASDAQELGCVFVQMSVK